MPKTLDTFALKGLLIVSAGLLCWGVLGHLEYMLPGLTMGLQNNSFPAGLQFIHFFALVLTGLFFFLGYLSRWPVTIHASITMYAVLATICFIETIDFGAFGGGATGVMIMLIEFALYVALSIYLRRSAAVQHHFETVDHRRIA